MEQTANQTSSPVSPKKKKWPKILGGVVAFIILAVGLAFYFTAGIVGVVAKQLEFLRQGDIKGAYILTSKDFQQATSLEQFTVFVKQYPSLSQNQGHTFTTRSIENNIGMVKGTLAAKGGAVTPVEFQLVKEQGEWRILLIEVRATGAGTGIKEEEKSGKCQDKAQAPSGPMDLGPINKDPKRIWTIAVYMGADNDLDQFALRNLKEMEIGLPEEGVECIVLLDRAKGPETKDDDRTDRVLRIKRNADKGLKSEVLARPGEVNMADPVVLEKFLASVIKTFPAQHYALIMWDHGGGWAYHLIDTDAPGAAQGHDKLSLPKLRQGISGGLKETGLKKLDLVGFDMCLMAQMETAAALTDLAEVMVASQALEPGEGWPYDQILPSFGKESLGARRLGAQIVDAFGKHYAKRQEQVATLSAIDLGEVQRLAEAMNTLATKMDQTIPATWPAISRAFFYSESYADRTDIRKGPSGPGECGPAGSAQAFT